MSLAVFAFACVDAEQLPTGPGGGLPPGGSSGMTDAGANGGDNNTGLITGRVCRIVNLHTPTACAQNPDMSKIAVTTQGGTAQTVTALNGSFVLDVGPVAPTTRVVVQAGAQGFQTTLLPLRAEDSFTNILVPIVDAQAWTDLLAGIGVIVAQETGSLAVYFSLNSVPLDGVLVNNVVARSGIFYDNGNGPLDWTITDPTGLGGTVLVFGVDRPAVSFTARDRDKGDVRDVANAPVGSDTVTFLTIEFD